MKTLVTILFLFIAQNEIRAQSDSLKGKASAATILNSEKFEQNLKEMEEVAEIKSICKVKVVEKRIYEKNKVDLVKINTYLLKSFELADIDLEEEVESSSAKIKPVNVTVQVNYCNYFQSSYGNLYLKGIFNVDIEKGSFLRSNTALEMTAEISLPKNRLGQVRNPKFATAFNKAEDSLLQKVSIEFRDKLKEKLKESLIKLYMVTTYGKSKYYADNIDKTKVLAVNDALNRATSKVFGFKISNETTQVDFGTVTDVVNQTSEGRVLEYTIDPNYNKSTTDGYYFTLVKSILKSN